MKKLFTIAMLALSASMVSYNAFAVASNDDCDAMSDQIEALWQIIKTHPADKDACRSYVREYNELITYFNKNCWNLDTGTLNPERYCGGGPAVGKVASDSHIYISK